MMLRPQAADAGSEARDLRAERRARLDAEHASERHRDMMSAVVMRLSGEAEARESRRRPIEQEWLRDVEQYHGIYDPGVRTQFNLQERQGKSQLFMNKTGDKTRAKVGVLMDMLFPADDRNWSIDPTPVPELSSASETAAMAQIEKAAAEGDPQAAAQVATVRQRADDLAAILEEAAQRAKQMEDEIADQLEECAYAAASRDVLENGCQIGTGIAMGPMTDAKLKRQWAPAVDENGQEVEGVFELRIGGDPRPAVYHVDPWSFFPSSDATCIADSEGFFVRHHWTKRRLRDFAKIEDVDSNAVRRLLQTGPQNTVPDYLTRLRAMGQDGQGGVDNVFTVWMYVGPLEPEEMRTLAVAAGDDATMADMDEVDPLDEVQAIVWFCGPEVLKLAIYPFDSGEPLFSMWRYEQEPGSFWGYGIPRIMRDDQKALNAAWRMILDNADLSGAPQVLIDKNKLEPANGSWVLKGGKLWSVKDGKTISGNEFATFDIPSKQAELQNIIELARRSIDESTHTPMLEQGEQGAGVTETAQGMALLMTASRRVDKRLVKNWDDDFTVPTIRRMYDWNMQFSDKPHIKGDYQIAARGSSVLLVRQQSVINIAMMLRMFADDPEFKATEAKREFCRALGYTPQQFIVTDAEREAMAADQPEEDPAVAIEMKKLELAGAEIELKREIAAMQAEEMSLKASIAEMEMQSRIEVAELQQETAMLRKAETMNQSAEQMRAKLTDAREARRSKERTVAAEIGIRSQPQAPANTTQIANQ